MARSILASVHLSSIYPASQAVNVSIDTARSDVPIPEVDPDDLHEHASYSSTFFSVPTGTILLRLIHGGLILELISLATGRSTRFTFPAPILPSPAILLHQLSELRIFVVISSGSLYTLTFPVEDGAPLFDATASTRHLWCHEYSISTPEEELQGPVYVKDIDCVLIGLSKGRFLRFDCGVDYSGWHESLHRINTSWTSFLTPDSEESHIVSFASHPPPTDSILVFTLSRDRILRAWSHGTCVSSYAIKQPARMVSSPAPRGDTPTNEAKAPLLGPESCTLIRVLPAAENDLHVDENLRILVFLPTSASLESGGWFYLFRVLAGRAASKDIQHVRSFPCSSRTAGAELRDFMVYGPSLYALWDQKNLPMVEFTHFDPDVLDVTHPEEIWHVATYPSEIELTPDYLDELLLHSGSGSLVDTFMTALLRPGIFSHFTIETALRQYIDSLLSIPGSHPDALRQEYLTLSEHIAAIVGCTVNVAIDPLSGVPQRSNYWNALKRDWEGFIARCREVERSGRWPLSLGVDGKDGTILILERERAGCVAVMDKPLEILSGLKDCDETGEFPVLEVGSMVMRKLSSAEVHICEANFETMVSQERGYDYSETLDHCFKTIGEPRRDVANFALSEIGDIELKKEFERALDIITSFQPVIKTEEVDESEEGQDVPQSTQWARGVTTDYVSASIEARYDLCLGIVVLLFHIDGYNEDLPPALLTRLFATFRNIAIARFLTWQPAGDPDGTQSTAPKDRDATIVHEMEKMAVSSRNRNAPSSGLVPPFSPTYSLIYRLMQESKMTEAPLPEASFASLRHLGLFKSQDAAEVTLMEAALCKWLVDLGFRDVALEIIGRLPRSPAISYVHGLLLIELGRAEDGAVLLQRVGANFASGAVIPTEDDGALRYVTQGTGSSNEQGYYKWIASLLEKAGYYAESGQFYKLSIELAASEEDTSDLWRKVITGYTELDMFEDAYMTLVTAPYESIKREAVSQLVQAMCEANAVDRLMSLNFVGLPNEVENALAFKVRNADPLSRPLYPQVLYAWYVFRGDFRNAAATMYQFARRLSSLTGPPYQFVEIAEMQTNAYLVAMNALSLIDPKSAWISMPVTPETVSYNRKRRKLSKHIPDDRYQPGCRDAEVVDLADMRHEYTLVSSRLELMRSKPELLAASQYVLSGAQIVSSYAQAGAYDYAISIARTLDVDMTELFERLTIQCLRLSRRGDAVLEDETTAWLHTERVAAWPGPLDARAWRYLREALAQHDTPGPGHRYRKAVVEALLARAQTPPSWLATFFQEHQPEYLIRAHLRYDRIGDAIEQGVALVRKANAEVPTNRRAAATWLPYGLIDAIIAAGETDQSLTHDAHNRLGDLRAEVATRVRRMQKWSSETRAQAHG